MAETAPKARRQTALPPTRGKTIVVMPALNAAKTLELTVSSIPRDVVDQVLLVDDRSTDETLEIARSLDVGVIWHPHNVGYGGNQKTCYLEALQREADIIVMLHPDGQYEPALIPKLIEPIQAGEADLVLGSRMLVPGAAREAGMPLYKRVANRFLTTVENRVLGTSSPTFTPATARTVGSCCSRSRSCGTRSTSASTPSCLCRPRSSASGSARSRRAPATSRMPPRSGSVPRRSTA